MDPADAHGIRDVGQTCTHAAAAANAGDLTVLDVLVHSLTVEPVAIPLEALFAELPDREGAVELILAGGSILRIYPTPPHRS